MANRALPHMTAEQRDATEKELLRLKWTVDRAQEDLMILVARCYREGMTTREIGAALGISSGTASKWKDAGMEAQERRLGRGPDETD